MLSAEDKTSVNQLEVPREPTVPERFAMAALTGLLASGIQLDRHEEYADAAWRHADNMLRRRPRPRKSCGPEA